jgi:glyoxylate reductase
MVGRPRVFITRALPRQAMDLIEEACDADVWLSDLPPPQPDLLDHVRDADGVLSLLTDPIDATLIEAASRLQVISNCAVGVDNVDVGAATRRKIPVGNTPDVLTDATADMAFALLLAAARRIVEGVRYVKAGRWQTWNLQLFLGADLAGATLGIIGLGRIGRGVARRAKGFALKVMYCDPQSKPAFDAIPVDLDTLLRESDFVSLHVPLTPATHHMINAGSLAKMKPGAILINTARGPIVDHQALHEALQSGRLGAAALDVTEPEPLPADSPLLELANCIVLPHLGSASKRTREQMALLAARNLVAGVQGRKMPHCVNPEVYQTNA